MISNGASAWRRSLRTGRFRSLPASIVPSPSSEAAGWSWRSVEHHRFDLTPAAIPFASGRRASIRAAARNRHIRPQRNDETPAVRSSSAARSRSHALRLRRFWLSRGRRLQWQRRPGVSPRVDQPVRRRRRDFCPAGRSAFPNRTSRFGRLLLGLVASTIRPGSAWLSVACRARFGVPSDLKAVLVGNNRHEPVEAKPIPQIGACGSSLEGRECRL